MTFMATLHRTSLCGRQTHQKWFKWRLYFASKEVVPIYKAEERMGLGNMTADLCLCVFVKHIFQAPSEKWCLPGLQLHLLDRPRVATRHFFSATRKNKNILTFDSRRFLTRHNMACEACGEEQGFNSSPFSEGPWLLAWGKVEGWVYILRFCLWSSFGFHRWTEAEEQQQIGNISWAAR